MTTPSIAVAPAIEFGEECHPGLKRQDNQDSVAHAETPHGQLFVISDGVGGYKGGAEASGIITRGIPRYVAASELTDPAAVLVEAVERVNGEVFAESRSGDNSLRRMSATIVLALLFEHEGQAEAIVGNIGDSRAYLFRGGQLTRLSTDHSAVQALLDAGVLTQAQAKDHPHANILTRSVGPAAEVTLALKRIALEPGDQLLLCSDGLHGFVEQGALEAALADPRLSAAECARALLDLALAAGGPDNISVQVVRLEAPAKAEDAGAVEASPEAERVEAVTAVAAEPPGEASSATGNVVAMAVGFVVVAALVIAAVGGLVYYRSLR